MARSKPTDPVRDAEGVLRRQRVGATDLVAAIHAVNPTGLQLPSLEQRHRYDLKSKLQSRLVLEFFDDLDFESTDQPGVIGLRYRPHDRDAAHAVLSELELDARSKVQLHLDTHEPAPAKATAAGSKTSPAPRIGSLNEGKRALAEYDYDTARACFEAALLEADDDTAAVALLELLVDQLAAWQDAVDLEVRLTPSQRSTPVHGLLAVAAAQLGDAAACHRLAKDGGSPRFAVAFCALASQCLQRAEFTAAVEALDAARALAPGSPEVIAVEGELTRLKAAQRQPAEQELEALLASGDALAAEEKARAMLTRWPESGPARRVVREADAKARAAQLATLGQQAQSAFEAQDDVAALDLWSQALALGAVGLEKSMAAASERIEARRRQAELDAVTTALRSGPSEQALTRYLTLAVADRRKVRDELAVHALEWLEQLGVGAQRDWPLNIAAVLALSTADERPASEHRDLLAPHEERVRRIDHGRALLAQAEAHAHQEGVQRDLDQLGLARAALSAGRWREVVGAAQGLHPAEHREAWKSLADEALARLESDARVAGFEARFAAGDTLGALAIVQAAEADQAADQELWASKRRTLAPRLRQHFRVQVGDAPDAVRACDFGNVGPIQTLSYGLDEDAAFAWWVTGLGAQLFIRKIDVREQRVVLMVVLTTPRPFSFARAQVEGATLRLLSDLGPSLLLSTKTWDVLRWHDADHVAASEVLEEQAIVPGGRHQWLSLRQRGGADEALRIVDLERGRVLREGAREGVALSLVVTERGPRLFLSGYRRGGRLLEPGGATEATLPLGTEQVSIAPTGKGLLVLRGERDPDTDLGEGEPFELLHLRTADSVPELVEALSDSDGDLTALMATSLEQKACFVFFSALDGSSWLAAYMEEGGKLERRWKVRCPPECLLLQDLQARHVVLITAKGAGLRCSRLGAQAPALEVDVEATPIPVIRSFDRGCIHSHDETLAAVAEGLQRLTPDERLRSLARVMDQNADKPDALASLARELSWRWGQGAEVMSLLRERFPEHVSAKLDQAEAATKAGNWEGVLAALDPTRGKPAASSTRAHVEHLRGRALFHLGRLDEASAAYAIARDEEASGCDVAGWPEWLDALAGKKVDGPAGQLVSILRDARAALAERRGREALTLLDVPLVWASFDVQLGAQLVVAAHDSNVEESGGRMRARLIVASFLEQFESEHRTTLPLGALALSPEKLGEVAALVKAWAAERT